MEARILNEFRAIVGPAGLITERGATQHLRVRRAHHVSRAAAGGVAAHLHRRGAGDRACVPSRKDSVRGPWLGHGTERRRASGRRWHRHQPLATESHSEVDLANQRSGGRARSDEPERDARVAPDGYFYAPDPSSQPVCSIGGNVAENSGGAHCLKYGFTTTHVLGLEVVLPDGSLVHLGDRTLDTSGIRPARGIRRLGRYARRHHQSYSPHCEEAGGDPGLCWRLSIPPLQREQR